LPSSATWGARTSTTIAGLKSSCRPALLEWHPPTAQGLHAAMAHRDAALSARGTEHAASSSTTRLPTIIGHLEQ
jgi:hypothetical protein